MKTTYYVASSLDGYIAREDGDVSWLDELGVSIEETGYEEFYSTVDGLVMGRKTYEMIVNFGQWPYGNKPVWICSSGKIIPMEGCNLQVGNTPVQACHAAHELNVKHLWLVGGGNLASAFLENKLLTNISLSLMPIILGGGIKLFGNVPAPIKIEKGLITPHASGFIQLEYTINNA